MELKKFKSITNGSRWKLLLKKNVFLKKSRFIKYLYIGINKKVGRSQKTGHITVRHKGGGTKKLNTKINFLNEPYKGIVVSIAYDANRSSFIALVFDFLVYRFLFILAICNLYVGSLIFSNNKIKENKKSTELCLGCRFTLKEIPPGSLINCLSLKKHLSSKYIRSAGNYGQVLQKSIITNTVLIRLPSGKNLITLNTSLATLGVLSNLKHKFIIFGKAGQARLKGIRPSVRGIAMNPVDHPHGGRTNGGCPSMTPWGKITRGKPTKKSYE